MINKFFAAISFVVVVGLAAAPATAITYQFTSDPIEAQNGWDCYVSLCGVVVTARVTVDERLLEGRTSPLEIFYWYEWVGYDYNTRSGIYARTFEATDFDGPDWNNPVQVRIFEGAYDFRAPRLYSYVRMTINPDRSLAGISVVWEYDRPDVIIGMSSATYRYGQPGYNGSTTAGRWVSSDTHQIAPVPLPAGVLLMLSGLGAAGLARRMSSRRSA